MREVMSVVNVDDKYVYLSLMVNEAGCSACALAGSCSVKGEKGTLRVRKDDMKEEFKTVMPGDTVIVDLKHNEAILSLIVYGIPLAGFLIGVLIGYILKLYDLISFVLGIGFAGAGALFTKLYDKKYKIEVIDVKRATAQFWRSDNTNEPLNS
ncbi:MAG: SoxR reducing system RseC family protein [Fervidobacterium sp.]|uniref:SoxR reducing system RseC family protein n=1 Tax=Fervidobacterium sp. TaxID=1871331 RepID=UPI004049AAA5